MFGSLCKKPGRSLSFTNKLVTEHILQYLCLFIMLGTTAYAQAGKIVNIYVWGGEIPAEVIDEFERTTGINVNFSTYDNNETMYAKLKAGGQGIYDVIMPSAYFVERMKKQGMLAKLDKQRLPNLANLASQFINNNFDRDNHYSVPLIWGATGIFYNQALVTKVPAKWQDLWQSHWRGKLLMLNDSREVFAIALMSLGFPPNDSNPAHIKQAYEHLLKLIANIKLFASESVQAIIIDEDAIAGGVWNGDAFKAQIENKNILFKYPQEGFVMWVDCLSIPLNAPHPVEAYKFINFLLTPAISALIAQIEGYAITNAKGQALLPPAIHNNKLLYPSPTQLQRGHFQRDVGEETLLLYNQYWQRLKLVF